MSLQLMDLLTLDQVVHSANARDGIPLSAEVAFRREALTFVLDLAIRLRLSQPVVATGQLLLHRVPPKQYTVLQSFRTFDRLRAAAACLFLAAKINEQIRSLADLTNAFFYVEKQKKLKKNPKAVLPDVTKSMEERLYQDVVKIESDVLRMIDFDVARVEVPYTLLKSTIRDLSLDREVAETVHKVAWNFANDSLRSQAYLLYPVLEVARACVYLACQYVGVEVTLPVNWECVERVIEVYNDSLRKEV